MSRSMSPWRRRWRTFWRAWSGIAGVSILAVLVGMAVAAPWIVGDPYAIPGGTKLLPPGSEHDGVVYWLGTDTLGRDMAARLVYGARASLAVGPVAVLLALAVGVPLGVLAGYVGGALDFAIMRATELVLSLPAILLAIVIVTILGPGRFSSVVLAVAIVAVPVYVRQVRATALAAARREYTLAAVALGASPLRILLTCILPACTAPIAVLATLGVGTAILDAAGLSFLGLGPEADTPEWGLMLDDARDQIVRGRAGWWTTVFPGAAILLAVLGFNLIGDAARDAIDERR